MGRPDFRVRPLFTVSEILVIRSLLGLVVVFALVGQTRAEDKYKSEDLVGSWKLVKSEQLPEGVVAIVTYAKDGTAKATVEFQGKKQEIKAKWKLAGDKLELTITMGDKDVTKTETIVKLTKTELVTKDMDGKTDEFKKVEVVKKEVPKKADQE